MTANILDTKSIHSLLGKTFFVNSYQRGYRWGIKEVQTLLEDIKYFSDTAVDEQNYCLQPVILTNNEGKFEVIDGQQRLTTIFLILLYLEKNIPFTIEYKTRTSSVDFLHKMKDIDFTQDWDHFIIGNNLDNKIDNFHFYQAYQKIQNWFETENIDNDTFIKYLTDRTEVIWFEVKNCTNAKEIFERINIGKIPLTNAELIKALFLNRSRDKLAKEEISQKWDRIEYAMQDERFWSFINHSTNLAPTRIEFIFDIIADKHAKTEDALHTFLFFLKAQKINNDLWPAVEECFHALLEWYESPKLYHYIGYLITTGQSSIQTLVRVYKNGSFDNKPKSVFLDEVKDIIRDKLKYINVESLSYVNRSDHQKITNILLLFNIQTFLELYPNLYFPFDRYKEMQWSIEHIHARESEGLTDPESVKAWIDETKPVIEVFQDDPDKGEDAKMFLELFDQMVLSKYKMEMNQLPEKVFNFFSDGDNTEIDTLSNLALLDRKTNSSVSNRVFPIKRKKIIHAERNGVFILPCTKNVFLKSYNDDIPQMHFWNETDKNFYMDEITNCLSDFLPSNHN